MWNVLFGFVRVVALSDFVIFLGRKSCAKQFINPPGLKALGMYSNVTCARGGTIAFISGQVAVDAKSKVVGPGDISAQAVQVFENLRVALAGIEVRSRM